MWNKNSSSLTESLRGLNETSNVKILGKCPVKQPRLFPPPVLLFLQHHHCSCISQSQRKGQLKRKSFHFGSPDLEEINAYRAMNLGLRATQIKLASSFIAAKGILSTSKWIVKLNEGD